MTCDSFHASSQQSCFLTECQKTTRERPNNLLYPTPYIPCISGEVAYVFAPLVDQSIITSTRSVTQLPCLDRNPQRIRHILYFAILVPAKLTYAQPKTRMVVRTCHTCALALSTRRWNSASSSEMDGDVETARPKFYFFGTLTSKLDVYIGVTRCETYRHLHVLDP
jgi:hypothetical protein